MKVEHDLKRRRQVLGLAVIRLAVGMKNIDDGSTHTDAPGTRRICCTGKHVQANHGYVF